MARPPGVGLQAIALVVPLALVATLASLHIYRGGLAWPPIRSDGFGYYAYLPSVLIDGDLDLHRALAHLPEGSTPVEFGLSINDATGRVFDKYPPGTALLQAPFFLAAHAIARPVGARRNGYSGPYQAASVASSVFYLCVGAGLMFAMLRRRFDLVTSLGASVLLVFGTSVFHYGTYDGSFSHIYAFALVALLAWDVERLAEADGGRTAAAASIRLGLVLGLITLTRANLTIVALLAAGALIIRHRRHRRLARLGVESALAAVSWLLLVAVQSAYWHHATGHVLLAAYPGEEFNWARPQVVGFLFSVRKGALFWSPALAVALAGLLRPASGPRWMRGLTAVTVALHVYVCSSWWSWWFGGGFGSRPFVDVAPLLASPLAGSLGWAEARFGRPWLLAGIACLTGISVTLMYAYWRHALPYDGTTWEALFSLPGRMLR